LTPDWYREVVSVLSGTVSEEKTRNRAAVESETVSIGTTWRKPLRRWTALWSYKRVWRARRSFARATVYGESVHNSLQTREISPLDEQKKVGAKA
jgi:hypothetical protein